MLNIGPCKRQASAKLSEIPRLCEIYCLVMPRHLTLLVQVDNLGTSDFHSGSYMAMGKFFNNFCAYSLLLNLFS